MQSVELPINHCAICEWPFGRSIQKAESDERLARRPLMKGESGVNCYDWELCSHGSDGALTYTSGILS